MSDTLAVLRDAETAPRFSKLRVWHEDDGWHVCRDWMNAPGPGPKLQPQHLTLSPRHSELVWLPHQQGGHTKAIPAWAFVAWILKEPTP